MGSMREESTRASRSTDRTTAASTLAEIRSLRRRIPARYAGGQPSHKGLAGRGASGHDAGVRPPLSAGSVAALASLLMTAAIPTRDATASDRGGRIELTTTATLYGVGLGVWSSMEGDLKPRPAAWLTAALGGGMLYGSYKLTDHLQLNTANVRYIEAAGAWTAVNGVLVASMTDTYGSYMVAVGFGTAAAGAGIDNK